MDREQFCKKWRRGWIDVCIDGTQAYFYTKEQMMDDLNQVIHDTVCRWKKFVDGEVHKSICLDLDEWQVQEAAAIQKGRGEKK